MKQIITYVMYVCIALIVLTFLEGICTMGQAFDFKQYNWLGYLFQGIVITATVCAALLMAESDISSAKAKARRF